PLLDACGRVIGINSAITRAEDGDSTFGFAIADSQVAAFLREAKQPFAAVTAPCTSIEERLRQDSEADARASADAVAASREAQTRAAMTREAALADARVDAERMRENFMGVAGLLLVLGAMGIGGAGLLVTQGRRRDAIAAGIGGGAVVIVAILIFVLRPDGEVAAAITPPDAVQPVPAVSPLGAYVCTIQPDRSRITVSTTPQVDLAWGANGCVDGKTQFVTRGSRWERTIVPDDEQTASTLSFDPARRLYTDTRYLLSSSAIEALRKLRGAAPAKACSIDPSTLAQQEEAIRAALPPLPNEKLVYSCAPPSDPAAR
ncbi:MAG: serine protease, partial [Sphingomonas bacterium]|nr:serine protease [Sphingomonas bacterium]